MLQQGLSQPECRDRVSRNLLAELVELEADAWMKDLFE